ncbi:hypothetical protein [Geothrix edaphica]|uniref:Uncharacterized protein n=1 Tax=Geothrix edaphica TaxID=2927976 RepID=A0ABQ5PWY7_9BACT|nr:hypothetical protein [Geothrix edaphica]GLH66982.1 hypothetical protein GETHED_13460 [Geothrix edaphica]
MDRFRVLLWVGWGIQSVSPLVPVLAAAVHARSERFQSFPWMRRLTALLIFQLFVNWTMLGMAMNRVRNAWVADLAHVPEVLGALWVLAGLGPKVLPGPVFILAAGTMVASAAWEAAQAGVGSRWSMAETAASLVLFALCLWLLKDLVTKADGRSPWNRPAAWLLGTWALDQGIMLMFYPVQNLFIHQLSRDWVLIPWLVRFIIGLLLNLALARTYLCRKTNSY